MGTPTAVTADEHTELVRCGCGNTFEQRRLDYGGPKPARWPVTCDRCSHERDRAVELQAASRALLERGERLERHLRELAVPPLFAGMTLAQWRVAGPAEARRHQAAALDFARRWLERWPDPPLLVCFAGGVGTGKTALAWALARAVVEEHDASARVVKLSGLVRELRDTWRKGSNDTEAAVLRRFTAPALLVLDECSRHALYGAPTQHLYDVLDARLELCRPSLLTSNEPDGELAALLGPAIVDRLEGHGGLVDFGAYSYRSHHGTAPEVARG